MASSIQLLRSTIAQERPFPGNLLEGQPAVNLNVSEPGLFFKAADGSLVKVGPAAITADGSPPNASATGQAGNAVGEMWLDKSVVPPVLKIYDGTSWIDAGSGSGGGSNVSLLRWTKTAIGGETSLSGSDDSGQQLAYTPGLEQVFLNGVLLERGTDYTGTNGTAFSNLAALTAGDIVVALIYSPFNVADIPDESIINAKLANNTITSVKVNEISSSKLTYIRPETGAELRTVQDRLEDTVSVKDFGATGDGTTDDTAAIQDAINAASATGRAVSIPAGLYRITSVLDLPVYTVLIGTGGRKLYPSAVDQQPGGDNSTDPNFSDYAPVLQIDTGGSNVPGAMFTCSNPHGGASIEATFIGICFRARYSIASLFDKTYSFWESISCLYHRLGVIMPPNINNAFGAIKLFGNYFNICGDRTPTDYGLFQGALVDCIVTDNTFTECKKPFVISASGGLNIWTSNRFEQGTGPAISLTNIVSRENVIDGNLFDAMRSEAITISFCEATTVISNNLFWRNGRFAENNKENAHISIGASSNVHIANNIFKRGGPDGNEGPFYPSYILSVGSLTNEGIIMFRDNNTHEGCTTSQIFVQIPALGPSRSAFEVSGMTLPSAIDSTTGTSLVNTAQDDAGAGISNINSYVKYGSELILAESRQINTASTASNLKLIGHRKTVSPSFGSFQVGTEYQILTVGNTDWTSLGATSNTAFLQFIATSNGSSQAGTTGVGINTSQVILKNASDLVSITNLDSAHNIRYLKFDDSSNGVSYDNIQGKQYATKLPQNAANSFGHGRWRVGTELYKSFTLPETADPTIAWRLAQNLGSTDYWESLAFSTVASAPPSTGAHTQGEVTWNSAATAGGLAGWICVVSGTPGTWKTFGTISP
jgi:hypothetical protein